MLCDSFVCLLITLVSAAAESAFMFHAEYHSFFGQQRDLWRASALVFVSLQFSL